MTESYTRKSRSGHTVRWLPNDPEAAARVVAAASGTRPERASDAARELNRGMDFSDRDDGGRNVSAEIRERYKKTRGASSGGDV